MHLENAYNHDSTQPSHIDECVSRIQDEAKAYKSGAQGSTDGLIEATLALQKAVEPPRRYVQRLRFQVSMHYYFVSANFTVVV